MTTVMIHHEPLAVMGWSSKYQSSAVATVGNKECDYSEDAVAAFVVL